MHIYMCNSSQGLFTPITLVFNTNRCYFFLRLNSRFEPSLRKWPNLVATLNAMENHWDPIRMKISILQFYCHAKRNA